MGRFTDIPDEKKECVHAYPQPNNEAYYTLCKVIKYGRTVFILMECQ